MNIQKIVWEAYKKRVLHDKKDFIGNFFNLTPNSLVFIITSRCNFSCKHCLRDFSYNKDLPFELFEKAVLEAKKYNFRHACLTGGEPLMYPEFNQALELLVNNGYRFSIVTNGYEFENKAPLIMKHKNCANFVAFSLESIDKEKHDSIRRQGSFEKLLANFALCKTQKIPFRIVTALSSLNHEELFDICLFAKKKGASAVALTTVLPCPRSEDNKMVLSSEKRQELFILARQLSQTIKLPILISSDIRANNNIRLCSTFEARDLTLDMDGNLVQCCELSNFDDKNMRKNAIITSLKDSSFDDALKAVYNHANKLSNMRINDYKSVKDSKDIDFNSCFYCIRKLSQ